jgi:hypothetical protein
MIKPASNEPFFKPKREFPKRSPGGFPVGPRTERRQKENRELNKLPLFVKNHCEIRIPGVCVKTIMLTWAHSKKSRFLVTSKDWQEAARCCLPCHDHIETLPHTEMKRLVTEAIKRRKL